MEDKREEVKEEKKELSENTIPFEVISDEKKEEKKETVKFDETLNVKALKKMNEYYEKVYKELTEKNDPEDKEKIEAIKAELDKNNEILNKVNIKPENKEKSVVEEPKIEVNEIKEEKKEEPKIEKVEEKKIIEKLVIILDCLRGEYLIRKSDLIEFKAYEIRTLLLDNKKARKEYLEELHDRFGEFNNDEIDVTLCKTIEEHYKENNSDEVLKEYINAINEADKEKLPFKLVYNFNGMKDLRKEGFLSRVAANRLINSAEFCYDNELADVQKEEKGLKRVINNFKKFFSKREFRGNINLLTEGEKTRKIKVLFKDGTYSLECGESKGKKYGDVYMYEAKCKIDDYDEIDKIEETHDLTLSNKEISRLDISIYKLLKNFAKLNPRAEESELNNLAEGYLNAIISKEVKGDVENYLEITYDLGCFDYISENVLSDYDLKQLNKKAKFAEKIGLANIEYSEEENKMSKSLIKELKHKDYFCKIADESDLDENNKKALEKLNQKIQEKKESNNDEQSIVNELAKENGIALKINNITKTIKQLKIELLDKYLKENN